MMSINKKITAEITKANQEAIKLKQQGLSEDEITQRLGIPLSRLNNELLGQQENKDTSRFINAGAQDVLWVQSPSQGIQEVLQIAIDRLSHVQGIILEGNSAIESLRPEIVIFVSANGEIKRGAEKILSMADAVIFDKYLPKETPTTAVRLHVNDAEKYIKFILRRLEVKIKKGHKP